MLWHFIRYWLTLFLPAFYKRIQVKNISTLQAKGPAIVAMNHPNAFIDPILITYKSYPQRLHYLARGDVFKPGMVTFLLEQIGIVPIYRMRESGKEGLKKNNESYVRVNKLLDKNAKMVVFAEGLCVQERRLRPLKKGIARMVFGTNQKDLKIIPVGINYGKPDKFRSSVFYNVGEPIYIKDFESVYSENQAKGYNLFLKELEIRLKDLITHIDKKENDEIVYWVEKLCKEHELQTQNLDKTNLEHDLFVLKQLTTKVNTTPQNILEEFRVEAKHYFDKLKANKISDDLVNPNHSPNFSTFNFIPKAILFILGFPFYLLGIIINFPPLWITNKLTIKAIKSVEFFSSIAIAFGMLIFLVSYIVWFNVTRLFFSLPSTVVLLTAYMLCGWLSLVYHPLIIKMYHWIRLRNNKALVNELQTEREKLVEIINKF